MTYVALSHSLRGAVVLFSGLESCIIRPMVTTAKARTGRPFNSETTVDDTEAKKEASSAGATVDVDVNERRLFPEDQAKVDAFLKRGVNSVDRKPFRPVFLILLLIAVVTGFSLLSQGIANWAGVY